MTAALVVMWGLAYGLLFRWNVAMVVAGALLGYAMGGGR